MRAVLVLIYKARCVYSLFELSSEDGKLLYNRAKFICIWCAHAPYTNKLCWRSNVESLFIVEGKIWNY